jgi:hypothetical protein
MIRAFIRRRPKTATPEELLAELRYYVLEAPDDEWGQDECDHILTRPLSDVRFEAVRLTALNLDPWDTEDSIELRALLARAERLLLEPYDPRAPAPMLPKKNIYPQPPEDRVLSMLLVVPFVIFTAMAIYQAVWNVAVIMIGIGGAFSLFLALHFREQYRVGRSEVIYGLGKSRGVLRYADITRLRFSGGFDSGIMLDTTSKDGAVHKFRTTREGLPELARALLSFGVDKTADARTLRLLQVAASGDIAELRRQALPAR